MCQIWDNLISIIQPLFIYNFCRCLTCCSCSGSCPLSKNLKQMQHFKNNSNHLKTVKIQPFGIWPVCNKYKWHWLLRGVCMFLGSKSYDTEHAYYTDICIYHSHMYTSPNEEKVMRFSWACFSWLSYWKKTNIKRYLWDCFKLQI